MKQKKKPKVLVVEPIHPHWLKTLKKKCQVVGTKGFTDDDLIAASRDVDGIIIRTKGRIAENLIAAASKLKVVGRHGVGIDHLDISAATKAGVWMCNTPAGSLTAVAEQTCMMMLSLAKLAMRCDRAVREGEFGFRSRSELLQLEGRTLGILGLGRIGGRVAEICHTGFRMNVIYTDLIKYRTKEKRLKARKVSLEQLLKRSDVLSVHVPLTELTLGMIGAKEMAKMKKGSSLLNLARGKIVDNGALAKALKRGRPGAAGLDVFNPEPLPKSHPLAKCENAIFSPHNGAQTAEARYNYGKIVLDVLRALEGKKPENALNNPNSPRARRKSL